MSSLNDLETGVLLDIFDFLSGTNLKVCAQVCSRWRDIIYASTSTMKKLPLLLEKNHFDIESLKSMQRNFHTIIIYRVSTLEYDIIKILHAKWKNSIKHIEILESRFDTVSLRLLLRAFKVENVLIADSQIMSRQEFKRTKILSLRTLVIIRSNFQILDILGCTGVKTLKVDCRICTKNELQSLKKFLSFQSELKNLALRLNLSSDYQYLSSDAKNKFALKKLSLSCEILEGDDHVTEFLKKYDTVHFESYKRLDISCYQYVMKYMRLRSLTVNALHFPEDYLFYNTIQPNESLKKLAICGKIDNLIVSQGLFRIYKNIDKLVIISWNLELANEILYQIEMHLRNLTVLILPDIKNELPEITLPSLKYLEIGSSQHITHVQALIRNQRNLETLSIKWISSEHSDTMPSIISGLKHLKHLIFGRDIQISNRLVNTIRRLCSNIETISLPAQPSEMQNIEGISRAQVNSIKPKIFYYDSKEVVHNFNTEKDMWKEEDENFADTATCSESSWESSSNLSEESSSSDA